MVANKNYLKQEKSFWSQVKLISMSLKYSTKEFLIKTYTIQEIVGCLNSANLRTDHLVDSVNKITPEGKLLVDYFKHRAEVLIKHVEPNLMNREQTKTEFEKLFNELKPKVHLSLNKQKGEKKHYAYLTGIVNILTEKTLNGLKFDANPRRLVVISKNKKPLRTFSR